MTIEEYFGEWKKVVDINEADRIIRKLIGLRQQICPQPKDIFKAFTLCSLSDLKVVILGQDPYDNLINGKPVATGIAFGNSSDTLQCNYSPSLDVLMESVIDFTCPHQNIIFDASLEKWEAQGVLLVNSALSCQAVKKGSHSLMWRPFIRSLLTGISNHNTGIVYVLMGSEAQSFEHCINANCNYIIKTRHPSWYARMQRNMPSDLWHHINQILKSLYGQGIEWYEEYNF